MRAKIEVYKSPFIPLFIYLFIYLFIHLLFFEKGNIIFIVDLIFEEQSQNSEGFLNEPSISAPVYR